jgi:hypothetical protein
MVDQLKTSSVDEAVDEALSGLYGALAEHVPAAANPEFADIRQEFADLRESLGMPSAGFEDGFKAGFRAGREAGLQAGRDALAALRAELGLPPSPVSPLSAAARPDGLPVRTDHEQLWERFGVPTGALQVARQHAAAYHAAPQWQRIKTVARAAGQLSSAIRNSAGSYWRDFASDTRVQGFALTVGLRVTRVIADEACALHAQLVKTSNNVQARDAIRKVQLAAEQAAAGFAAGDLPAGNDPRPSATAPRRDGDARDAVAVPPASPRGAEAGPLRSSGPGPTARHRAAAAQPVVPAANAVTPAPAVVPPTRAEVGRLRSSGPGPTANQRAAAAAGAKAPAAAPRTDHRPSPSR